MRTLITGACGRVGRGVGAVLRKHGHYVVGVDVLSAGDGVVGVSCDAFVRCDLAAAAAGGKETQVLCEAMTQVTAVVHCAAWPGPSATPPPAVQASGAAVPPAIGLEPAEPSLLLRDNVGGGRREMCNPQLTDLE